MPYCRKWNRKERWHSRQAGPLAGLGRAPGRAALGGGRPPSRPRPVHRPAALFWLHKNGPTAIFLASYLRGFFPK